jgi:hypothetical protein
VYSVKGIREYYSGRSYEKTNFCRIHIGHNGLRRKRTDSSANQRAQTYANTRAETRGHTFTQTIRYTGCDQRACTGK